MPNAIRPRCLIEIDLALKTAQAGQSLHQRQKSRPWLMGGACNPKYEYISCVLQPTAL